MVTTTRLSKAGNQLERGNPCDGCRDKHKAAEMWNRVISFEKDWNAPGMEVYDELRF